MKRMIVKFVHVGQKNERIVNDNIITILILMSLFTWFLLILIFLPRCLKAQLGSAQLASISSKMNQSPNMLLCLACTRSADCISNKQFLIFWRRFIIRGNLFRIISRKSVLFVLLFVWDFRNLNAVTVNTMPPEPNFNDFAKEFSQIRMFLEHVWKTTVRLFASFEFLYISFDLKYAAHVGVSGAFECRAAFSGASRVWLFCCFSGFNRFSLCLCHSTIVYQCARRFTFDQF